MGDRFRTDVLARRANPGGFTLLELLVVVAIMALLMGIILPSMGHARLSAEKSVCMANLRSIGQAMRAYLGENNDVFPWCADLPTREKEDAEQQGREPLASIYEGLKAQVAGQQGVFECPADENTMMVAQLNGYPTYFESEGTSYEWEKSLNGWRVDDNPLTSAWGVGLGAADAPMIYDYEPFHGGPRVYGSHLTLYVDLHVAADNWAEGQAPAS